MMTDEEIIDEAKRRLAAMDPELIKQEEDKINEGIDLCNRYWEKGMRSLSREERRKMFDYEAGNVAMEFKGLSYNSYLTEASLMEEWNMSRKELAAIEKNPFKKPMLIWGLMIPACVIILIVLVIIEKNTDVNLGFLAIPFVIGTVVSFIVFLNKWTCMGNFKQLQKNYRDPELEENAINLAVRKMIRERVRLQRKAESQENNENKTGEA